MRQPLLSSSKPSHAKTQLKSVALVLVFVFTAFVLFSHNTGFASERGETAISEAEKSPEGKEKRLGLTPYVEVPQPPHAPPIDTQALRVAELGWPMAELAYVWRQIPVQNEEMLDQSLEDLETYGMLDVDEEPLDPPSPESDVDARASLAQGVINGQQALMVLWPGTESLGDWIRDFESLARPFEIWEEKGGWQVGKGFMNRYYESMELDDFHGKILDHVEQINPEVIYVAGHSLGGALASICAADFATDDTFDGIKIILITFGSPRTFETNTAQEVNDIFKLGNPNGHEAWRFVNFNDFITSTPQESLGFKHIGRVFYINKKMMGSWTMQEQHQEFTPYQAVGMTTKRKGGKTYTSTHKMPMYRERLQEVDATAVANNLFKGGKMKVETFATKAMDKGKSLLAAGKSRLMGFLGGKKKEAQAKVEELKGRARAKAQELEGRARGKANQLREGARAKAQELEERARGKANQLREEARTKAQELEGRARGKANQLREGARSKAQELEGRARGRVNQMREGARAKAEELKGRAQEKAKSAGKGLLSAGLSAGRSMLSGWFGEETNLSEEYEEH